MINQDLGTFNKFCGYFICTDVRIACYTYSESRHVQLATALLKFSSDFDLAQPLSCSVNTVECGRIFLLVLAVGIILMDNMLKFM